MQSEPWLERDKAMIDPIKSLGIEKGRPFNPDATSRAALEAGARDAHPGTGYQPVLHLLLGHADPEQGHVFLPIDQPFFLPLLDITIKLYTPY